MEIRTTEPRDVDRIRRIAEQSFKTSYSLSPDQIETILSGVFSEDAVAQRIESDARFLFVAVDDDESIGFADVKDDDQLFLRWLHVDPEHRGQGAGTALFEHVSGVAADKNRPLVARALIEGGEGEKFCEQFGFEQGEQTKLEFDNETFFGYTYVKPDSGQVATDASSVDVPDTVTTGGKTFHVDTEDDTPGTDGLFFRIYEGENRDSYGYLCSNCGSVDVGSDSLGRLECQNCGNKHLADEWDAAYL